MSTVIPKFAHERIQQGIALHNQIQDYSGTLSAITPQAEQLRYTANALWQAIEVQYSTQTDRDVVPVAWMHMQLPRSEWRQRLSVLDREATTLEHQRVEFQAQHDVLKTQLTSLQRDTVAQLRQLYAADTELPATTVEYLTQIHAQHLAAAISDWDGAIAANATAQKIAPSIELADQGILFQAFLHVRNIAANTGNLDKTMAMLESILSQRTATTITPVQITTLLQAQHLHAALFAAKAPLIQATQGAAGFDTQFQHLKDGITQFEKRVASPEHRDASASAHVQLVRVLWAAHRYQDAFAEAAHVQRAYTGTSAATELDAPQCWLYRARPEAYAPGGLIRENLSEISFSGVGAAAREAWAHTNENSTIVRYGLPTLGCVAGAVIASKFGAAAGTTVGPEGTVLGFGAGAATGCGLGAAAGKITDWAASAITAPEVAQSLLTGVSDETLGMTWARMNFAALDLATTYFMGKTLWSPALGLAQGSVDVAGGFYKLGRYTITEPVAALTDIASGIATGARVSTATAKLIADAALQPITTLRMSASTIADGISKLNAASFANAASVAGSMLLTGITLFPDTALAVTAAATRTDTRTSKLDAMINAALKPGLSQWGISIPLFFFGTWATGRMFWLDKLLAKPAIQAAIANEARVATLTKIINGSKISFGSALWQSSLINLPWVYQQLEGNNSKPLLMAVGSFSDVAYVVGSMLARSIIQSRLGGKSMTVQIEGPVASWLRKSRKFAPEGIANLQLPIARHYVPFFGLNVLFSQINNQTLGRFFTDGELKPWLQRNAVQPIPMFPRKIVAVFLGISTPAALTLDWLLNTYENRFLSWLFPPWSGRNNWVDSFSNFSSHTPWEDMLTHFEDKMERGAFQLPTEESAKPWGQRLLEVELSDYYTEMQAGRLKEEALNSVAQQVIHRAAPERFSALSSIEKKIVLVNLAFFIKSGRLSHNKEVLETIQPHLYLLNLTGVDEIHTTTVEDLLERINSL